MKLSPIADRVVVRKLKPESMSAGGIALPANDDRQEAEILAVGPGKRLENGSIDPMPVKVGDRVITSKHGGIPLLVDGKELFVMREADLYAVVE